MKRAMQFQAQSKRNKIKNADCICNLRLQSAFVNQLVLNQ
ncbi:hypothetical protein HMPREF1579_01211 [Gardnerella vaginalis JCP8066]|nr:hypothetical protein HMPREF1579_01211 [Gardnerella vaginalis JCP8066]